MVNIKKNHDLGMLLLRLAVGVIFIAHGWGKFSDMASTIGFFGQLGMPSVFAYLVGALLLYWFGRTGFIAFPWSSFVLYVLLSATAILFYIATSLGTEIPSSIILESFKRKKQQTFKDLTALFTDKGLIVDRVDDLIQSTLVMRHGDMLQLTGRGKIVWRVMEIYRWIFHRTITE